MKIVVSASLASSLVNFRGALLIDLLSGGHEVYVLAPQLSKDLPTYNWLISHGIKCHDINLSRASINPFLDIRAFFEYYSVFLRIKPDLLLVYTIKPILLGLIASFFVSTPSRIPLITGLGYAFTEGAGLKRIIVRLCASSLYRFALQFSTFIFFQNVDDFQYFNELGLIPKRIPTKIVSGSGVDLLRFPFVPLHTKSIRFLLIARLLVDKGIREYAMAAHYLRRFFPDVEFHLVGGIDPNPSGIKKAEVTSWHDSGDLIWHGPVLDVRPHLATCTVYVLPSYREGMPRTVLEALATGRPILTTNVPGCRETVIEGENGFLFPPRDFLALADAMSKVIKLPRSELLRMGIASNKLARERFDVDIINYEMIRAIES